MDLAASVARRMGFPADRIEDIKTAVSEATTNAIEHGNNPNGDQKVLIILAPEGEKLEIAVKDQSDTPFPPAGPAIPNLGDKLAGRSNSRGWGMFLIKELVDEVEFTSSRAGNEVRMVVHLKPASRTAT